MSCPASDFLPLFVGRRWIMRSSTGFNMSVFTTQWPTARSP
jgi:hypothetical protein